jgi:hypothetical protein
MFKSVRVLVHGLRELVILWWDIIKHANTTPPSVIVHYAFDELAYNRHHRQSNLASRNTIKALVRFMDRSIVRHHICR